MIIGRLRGEVATVGTDSVMIDVNGVGYVALAGTRLLSKLNPGQEATVHIETRVTENSITLFAFESDEARAWFVRLQDVPGVAGKSAMAIMDSLSPTDIMDALALGDAATITRAKGVGKKLAERIIGELSGKPPPMGRFGAFRTSDLQAPTADEPLPASGARS
ncbi:MAG: Holliday junction branch migration protein RuvA, partial [Henriciella sp.]|uniref:Holliday junction branch migration protein RuvA n=1 Tax=Henriciella sp. TaxID=1968823 RepID=UPI003C78BD31